MSDEIIQGSLPELERLPSVDDQATQIEELERESAINAQRRRAAAVRPLPEGVCANCDAPLLEGHFCDAECRADYDRRAAARQRNGSRP